MSMTTPDQNPQGSSVSAILVTVRTSRQQRPDIRPWDIFKATIDMLLVALKYDPAEGKEAVKALKDLIKRIYNEDFLDHQRQQERSQETRKLVTLANVTHDEIREFLYPKERRFVQILPHDQLGSDVMEQIVTLLTMTSDTAHHEKYNEWATGIVMKAVAERAPKQT